MQVTFVLICCCRKNTVSHSSASFANSSHRMDVDTSSTASAAPTSASTPAPSPTPVPVPALSLPEQQPSQPGAGDRKDDTGRQLRLPQTMQGIRYFELACGADTIIELLYQQFSASPTLFASAELRALRQVLEQRRRDQNGLASTTRPTCRDWFIGLLRSNFVLFNESRDDKQNHIIPVPRLRGELDMLSLIGILFCPNSSDLRQLLLSDNIEAPQCSLPARPTPFALASGCGIHCVLDCSCPAAAPCAVSGCNRKTMHRHRQLPVLSLSAVCRESLKPFDPTQPAPKPSLAIGPEAATAKPAATASPSMLVQMDEAVNPATFVVPDGGLIDATDAISEYLKSSDFHPKCVSCGKQMQLNFSGTDPGLLVVEFGHLQNVYGSTAQAIRPASMLECTLNKSRYRLVGIIYWQNSPRHFTAEILVRMWGQESFYFFDDLNGGKLTKTGPAPSQKFNGSNLRANAILMFYERIAAMQ